MELNDGHLLKSILHREVNCLCGWDYIESDVELLGSRLTDKLLDEFIKHAEKKGEKNEKADPAVSGNAGPC